MLNVKQIQKQIAQVLSSEDDVYFLSNFFKKTNFSKPETVLTVLAIKAKEDNFSWVSKDITRERVVSLLAKIDKSQKSSNYYDTNKLNAIPIDEVLELFKVKFNGKDFLCPNDHKSNKQKLTVYHDKNICKCHNCNEVKGSPVSVATWLCKGDFIEACQILAQHIGEDNAIVTTVRSNPVKSTAQEIKYRSFDKSRGFIHVEIKDYMETYITLKEYQKMKLIYSFIYRYSISTKRDKLNKYYKGRGIKSSHLEKIGFLSKENIIYLVEQLKKWFPKEDLVKFNVINSSEHKHYPLSWKQIKECALVPSFDIYTDLVESFMLRPLDKSNNWFKGKESALSTPLILDSMPFGIGYKILSGNCDIYITEGHIDALSLPEGKCFIAAPGINSFREDQLGLLKGRNIKLVFDQDDAGQKAAHGFTRITFLEQTIKVIDTQKSKLDGMLKNFKSQGIKYFAHKEEGFKSKLLKAEVASVEVITWDINLGKDLNDLLINGNMSSVIKEK